jgi:ribonuclease R
MNLPFIYRNHDKPNSEKLDRLFKILSNLGFEYKKHNIDDGIYTKSLQSILNQVEGTPSEKIISSLMLKSMAKANYSNENIGHFGLASQFYTHFTSPIRRYPDLIVHRLLRTYLFNKSLDLKTINKYDNMLYEIGVSTSKSERTAIDLEREVEDIKKAEYVVKMTFPQKALISSVTSFGVFVELENTSVTGINESGAFPPLAEVAPLL